MLIKYFFFFLFVIAQNIYMQITQFWNPSMLIVSLVATKL